ncbi:unnamed protein product [marine sediment metagenome]|uniref:HTH marR-type domain-containing protein n=1 Tax=marine sediment metagenome TaxID=412755 RepID=X1KNW4_9ZZZZ
MGILDGTFFKKKVEVSEAVVVGLTPLGATKAESLYGPEGIKGRILLMLKDAGPSTIPEIAEETKVSPHKVKPIVKSLIASGYAKRVTGD